MSFDVIDEIPDIALAVYAHPDDADIACGGTLARWVEGGCAVHLIVCSDGGKGSSDAGHSTREIAIHRAQELAESASKIGIASHRVLGVPDGEVGDPKLWEDLVCLIREFKPSVVLSHDPTAVFFGQHYYNHRDHRALGWALLDAVAPAASLPHYVPRGGPPHQVTSVYLSGTTEADSYVDISSVIAIKVAAVECHVSQFAGGDPTWVDEAVQRRASEEGRRCGVEFAEGFRRLRLDG